MHVKDLQTMTLLWMDLARRGDRLENDGRTTFHLNMVRNGPMWQYLKLLRVGVEKLGVIWGNLWPMLETHYIGFWKLRNSTVFQVF